MKRKKEKNRVKIKVEKPIQKTSPDKQETDFEILISRSIEETQRAGLITDAVELRKIKSVIDLIDGVVKNAYESKASDIHIDPQPETVIIRFRIDGILHDVVSLDKSFHPLILTRVKVLSGLRTDEHFIAQDGRFRIEQQNNEIDIRVSIVPTHFGENVVMRLLVGASRVLGLGQLGFNDKDLKLLHQYIKKPYGMILSTGPTGSGKTTTLYSILRLLNARSVSIVTIEDPIEYAISGVSQIQVNPQTNLTFAAGLRSIVRQDPNIIMVGEIRDRETAGIAINAAMTGHLLLSTLHTNDAATTLPRLNDMGIEPFLIASTVNIIIGQRLVRKLCQKCKTKHILNEDERRGLLNSIPEAILKKQKQFWRAGGCAVCNQSGYEGRIGIFELLEVNDAIRKLIMRSANADEIREAARTRGMTTMLEDGFTKATQGATSIAELIRVIHD